MITEKDKVFYLDTANTSYIFRVTRFGHLEHIYYGGRLADPNIEALCPKRTAQQGSSVVNYSTKDPYYSLDLMCFEWSGIGKGDYRLSPAEMKMPDNGFINDFIYLNHTIQKGAVPMIGVLPTAKGADKDCTSLIVEMREKHNNVYLRMIYTVYERNNVITRRVILENRETNLLVIRRLLSLMIDMPNLGYNFVTFDGDWSKETHRHDRPVQYGIYVNESRTGSSSNKHNPGFLLYKDGTSQDSGAVYGFNLVYSGNHFGFVELNSHELCRAGIGISPHCFEWSLAYSEQIETPEAVMSFSNNGFNGLSRNFHGFINNHIVPEMWQGQERPILYNSWEPCFFKFTQGKLLRLARMAKKLGMELFVLDDGWFEGRDTDAAGLSNYQPNRKKFPRGLAPFARKIRRMGLDFGIWFEPEMINEDSHLYRAFPKYAVTQKGRDYSFGRNQLVLDLCNPAVRDYIVDSVGKVLDDTGASYVKWDMNRHITDFWSDHIPSQGAFFHSYILGLYDILTRIFKPRPHILLESCSSGGNRFDLGMLCFSPQIWASDNTDPIERLSVQGGLSYLYPQSTMGAHVSDAPHQQTLRTTPLSTRYNVASFGCLGYELDLRFLTPAEKREIKDQIIFYKAYRKTLQYGYFERLSSHKENKVIWLCRGDNEAIAGFFQTLVGMSEGPDQLQIPGLNPYKNYLVTTRPQRVFIKRFGGLVKHILPFALNPEGFILQLANRHFDFSDCVESRECNGDVLSAGILLNNQFMGGFFTEETRLLSDFGSSLYTIEEYITQTQFYSC
jgi:alpha-galactosidase